MKTTRSIALGFALALSGSTSALAASYEYNNPVWYSPYGPAQPYLAQIGITDKFHLEIQKIIAGSSAAQAIKIAILDGRVDNRQIDLTRVAYSTAYRGSYSRYDKHGTHVAGIAGAALNGAGIVGVDPFAQMISIPVFDNSRWVATDLGKAALDKARSSNANVVNMSYGPTTAGDVFLSGELSLFKNYNSTSTATTGASHGMVLVRAAGNSGVNALNEYYTGNASADLSNLLIVGSVDANNVISSFSNRPGSACISTAASCAVTSANAMAQFWMVAPGENILSDLPNNYIGYMSGTSMAAPMVTGAAALVYQEALASNTPLTPGQVASILKTSATDLGVTGIDAVYGWGLLNVPAALGPLGTTSVATASTVDSGLVTTTKSRLTRSSVFGQSGAFETALDGMVVFDDYKRPFAVENAGLATPESTLVSDAVAGLTSSLAMTRTTLNDDGSQRLAMFQNAATSAPISGLSFLTDSYSVSAGLGAAKSFFTQDNPVEGKAPSFQLGSQFLTGAGDVATGFDNGLFGSADLTLTPGFVVSALYLHGSQQSPQPQAGWVDAQASDAKADDLVALGSRFALSEAASFGLSYGLLREEGSVLGLQNAGGFSLGAEGVTHLFGANFTARVSDKIDVSAFAQMSLTNTAGSENSVFAAASDWQGSKMGATVSGTDMLQPGDMVQFSVIRPWRVDKGDLVARVATGRELDGTVNYEYRRVSLSDGAAPLDLGLAYSASYGELNYGVSAWLRDNDVRHPGAGELAVAAAVDWAF